MGIASSLAGTTFGVRLLHVGKEELVAAALGAPFGRRVAVDDRAALLAAPVAIATVAALHRGGRGEEVADAPDLVRDRERLDAASGLIRVDESASERIKLLVGFLHVAPPCALIGASGLRNDGGRVRGRPPDSLTAEVYGEPDGQTAREPLVLDTRRHGNPHAQLEANEACRLEDESVARPGEDPIPTHGRLTPCGN